MIHTNPTRRLDMNSVRAAIVVRTVAIGICLATLGSSLCAAERAVDERWWDQQKIRFIWGQWSRFESEGTPLSKVIANLAVVGATVFVEDGHSDWRHAFRPERLTACRKHGLRHFGAVKLCNAVFPANNLQARLAIDQNGRTSLEAKEAGEPAWMSWADWAPSYVACPMEERVIEQWLVKPALECATEGLDGLLIDWEPYATGFDSAGSWLCFCDDCFGKFIQSEGSAETVETVPASKRVEWLHSEHLWEAYLQLLHDRYRDLLQGIAARVREIKPDFIFSTYCPFITPEWLSQGWRILAAMEGLGSPKTPLFYVDESHYWPGHAAPWWDLYTREFRSMGCRHIIGSFTNGWTGHPSTGINLEQYIYESALHSDGTWTWFEAPLKENEYRVFRAANQRLATVEGKVGEYLFQGTEDAHFACLVERSGSPSLGAGVIQRSYHLGSNHLVHITNVNTDRAVDVKVRLAQLSENSTWTLCDPIGGLHFLRVGRSPVWSAESLRDGVALTIGKRSDAWVLLEPTTSRHQVGSEKGIVAESIDSDPERTLAEESRAANTLDVAAPTIVYLKARTEGTGTYPYYATVRTAVHAVGVDGQNDQCLFATKGNCWSPTWSQDGQRLAFSCYVNGRGQIYVKSIENVYNASNNTFCDHSPCWSPDGKHITFVSDRDGDWEIYVMNADGTEPRRLTANRGRDGYPRWSPDGQRIAFESARQNGTDIWVMNPEGAEQKALSAEPGNEREPTWSPDGKSLACTFQQVGDRRSMLVINVEDGVNRKFFAPWAIRYTKILSLCWSPDGKKIAGAFAGGKNTADSDGSGLFVLHVDGSGQQEILKREPLKPRSAGEEDGQMLGAGWYTDYSASQRWIPRTFRGVRWLPDGTGIVFSADLDESGDFYLYTLPAEGGEPARLDETRSAWEQWCVVGKWE